MSHLFMGTVGSWHRNRIAISECLLTSSYPSLRAVQPEVGDP
jgi:hypothetical protein